MLRLGKVSSGCQEGDSSSAHRHCPPRPGAAWGWAFPACPALLDSRHPAEGTSSVAGSPFLGSHPPNGTQDSPSSCADLALGPVFSFPLQARPTLWASLLSTLVPGPKMRRRWFTCPKLQSLAPEAASTCLPAGTVLLTCVGPESLPHLPVRAPRGGREAGRSHQGGDGLRSEQTSGPSSTSTADAEGRLSPVVEKGAGASIRLFWNLAGLGDPCCCGS